MKVVFWAGGFGTRMGVESRTKPKPMVEIGGYPLLWHLMQFFSFYNHNDFVVASGYKSEYIKRYFLDYVTLINDYTVNTAKPNSVEVYDADKNDDNWNITVADTGVETLTAGRLLAVERYVRGNSYGKPITDDEEPFIVTYGDSLSDVNIDELVTFHKKHGKLATITVSHPTSRFGIVESDDQDFVRHFKEKPILSQWINSGFFCVSPKIFEILKNLPSDASTTMFEDDPIKILIQNNELKAFKHYGFYQPIDTKRELVQMQKLWDSKKAPWKVWD